MKVTRKITANKHTATTKTRHREGGLAQPKVVRKLREGEYRRGTRRLKVGSALDKLLLARSPALKKSG